MAAFCWVGATARHVGFLTFHCNLSHSWSGLDPDDQQKIPNITLNLSSHSMA
jgi:hypothetical protein